MGILENIDFGRFDAEQDENILDYFIEIGATAEVLSGKYMVIGRKGAGKTALFKYVSAKLEDKGDVVKLDLEGYVFAAHNSLVQAGVPKAMAYTMSWRFAIAILMYLEVRDNLPARLQRRGDRALKDINSGPNRNAMHAIADWLKRIRSFSLPSVSGVVNFGSLSVGDPANQVIDTTAIDALEELEKVLTERAKLRPITALIDRLDDAWDGTEESLQLIAGAARAARHYSQIFPSSDTAPTVIFLRADLWDAIRFNDKNKFKQDSLRLDWSDDELKQVIVARIAKASVDGEADWNSVFTSSEMRQRTASDRYIIKRCIGRPRDIVAFALFAKDAAVRAGHEIIDNRDIYEAEKEYSRHVVDEMIDELQSHLQNVDSVIGALKGIGQRTFLLSAWNDEAEKRGMTTDVASNSLDKLFESSVVGVYRAGGGGGGSKTVYRYQDRFIQASETGQLQVHPAFTKELALKDT